MPPLHGARSADRNAGPVILPLPEGELNATSMLAYWRITIALRDKAIEESQHDAAYAYSERLDWLCDAKLSLDARGERTSGA